MDRRLVTPLLLVVVFSALTGWVSGRWLLGVSVAAIGVGGVLRRWPGSVAGEDARSTGGASSVVLVAVKPKKIPVIRVIRAETALGLKESKRLTDRGGVVAYGLSSGDADRLVGLLTDAGATARRVDLPPG